MDNDTGLNSAYISRLTAADWGLYKTLTINLARIRAFASAQIFPAFILARVDTLCAEIERQPKSLAWKTRALVGERGWPDDAETVRRWSHEGVRLYAVP